MAYVLALVVGMVMGSGLNVALWRGENSELGGRKRSACPGCLRTLSWFELIPVVSYIFLRGACRTCKRTIPWWYTATEVMGGILGLTAVYVAEEMSTGIVGAIAYSIFLGTLLFVALYDFLYRLIPVVPVIVCAVIGIFFDSLWLHHSLQTVFLSGCGAAGFFGLQYLISRGRWIGSGDIYLGFMLGIWLVFPLIAVSIWLSYVLGALLVLTLLAVKIITRKTKIPLGSLLALGAVVSLVVGNNLLSWYQNLF